MTLKRTGTLLAAIALAAIGTVGLTAYVRGAKDRAVAGEKRVAVYVADGKITAGTPATELASHTKREDVPANVLADGAVTNLDDLKGLVPSIDVAPGEQLLKSRFLPASVQAAQVQSSIEVPAGFFQSTVLLEPSQALGGQVRAGNRVAVVAMDTKSSVGASGTTARAGVIVRDALVTTVQIDGERGQGSDGNQQVANAPTGKFLVTLALTEPDLASVVTAVNNGTVWLAADPGSR
jgi:pilus assembly protein CpaB